MIVCYERFFKKLTFKLIEKKERDNEPSQHNSRLPNAIVG